MVKTNRNIRVVAKNVENSNGFNIYLDFSGQLEFVMYHRHNGFVYNLLKDSQTLDGLMQIKDRKIRNRKRNNEKLNNAVDHILDVIDWYMTERNEDLQET